MQITIGLDVHLTFSLAPFQFSFDSKTISKDRKDPGLTSAKVSTVFRIRCVSDFGFSQIYFIQVNQFIFDNLEDQRPMWTTYLHTRTMYNI